MALTRLRPSRRLLAVLCLGVVATGLAAAVVGFRHFRAEVLADSSEDRSFRAPLVRVELEDGRPARLTLAAAALPTGLIVTRSLEAVRFQPEVPAVGTAVDPVDLATTRDRLVDAAAAEPATSRAAVDTLRLRHAVALALYGPGLTEWMTSGRHELDALLRSRASLLLLTPLPGHAAPLPAEATARGRRGEAVQVHLVSVAYRIDPHFQNIAALYETADEPTDPHFIPGLAVAASLPVGPALDGVIVPAASVLRYAGKAWAYVADSPERFHRQEISLAHPLPDGSGWFQESGFRPDQSVVVAGAALLLEADK